MRSKISDINFTSKMPIRAGSFSKRAMNNKLFVDKSEKTICPYCNHNKKFIGNSMGLMIDKCARCKKEY